MEKFNKVYYKLEIPNLEYEGYIWFSDKDNPEIFDNVKVKETKFLKEIELNPFIVEGNLYSKDKNISISIKHFDCGYVISEVKWDIISDASESELKEYLANPVFKEFDIKKLKFRELWSEEPDELCEYLPVLVPTCVGFIGFNKEAE